MDVKFINPFLNGASEVIKTMAFLEAVAGKPYLKKDETARGDVSGIIGITGDAIGSLAISFSEGCICGIVGSMLGETYTEPTQEVLDAAGELTNMISGVARTNLEKMGLQVYAAIPSVIFGKDHTIRHILKSPSIVTAWSGIREKPVIRSKFSLISLNRLYFEVPDSLSECPTSISVGLRANFWASAGMNVVVSEQPFMRSMIRLL